MLSDRRRAATVIGVVGGLAVLIGAYSISGAIRNPFLEQRAARTRVAQADLERILGLRTVDTDRDTLSDYDELYRYRTSPYLADTDSDTFPDATEVQAGSDPNCPAGSECAVTVGSNTNGSLPGNTNASTAAAALSGQLSAAELRDVLARSGAPQYLLDATPDDQLLSLYRSLLSDSGLNVNTSTANANSSVTAADIGNLTAADIRALLAQNGVEAETLNAVDDATLLSIFRQSLEDVEAQNP